MTPTHDFIFRLLDGNRRMVNRLAPLQLPQVRPRLIRLLSPRGVGRRPPRGCSCSRQRPPDPDPELARPRRHRTSEVVA